MAEGFKMLKGSMFKSTLTIQANPGAAITATGPTMTYSGTADSNGVVELTIERAGTYTITTNNAGAVDAEDNTATVAVLKSNSTYTGQMVKLNVPADIKVGNYSSNVLTVYWGRPSANWTGCHVRRGTGSAPATRTDGTDVYTGAGSTIDLTYSTNVNGVNNSGLTKDTTYYYAAWAYITIAGKNYYAPTKLTASGTARYYIGTEITIKSTQSAWATPTGWRKLKDCVVGAGGAGGAGGGGGGGGYVINGAEKSVKPGQTFKVVIGKGGTASSTTSALGADGEASSFGSDTAAGGQGGAGYDVDALSGRNGGGKGGSGGGARASSSSSRISYNGGDGGSNGTDGANTDTSTPLRYKGGVGQGTTTKAFGTGTAYGAGGGGGTQYLSSAGRSGGKGGATGGGNGGAGGESGSNGSANSGGGGGASGYSSSGTKSPGSGGSGVVIVRCTA